MSSWCILRSYLTKYGISRDSVYVSEMFCILQKIQWHVRWDMLGFWAILPTIIQQILSIFMTYQYQFNISPKTGRMAKYVVNMFNMTKRDDICYVYFHYSTQNWLSLYSYIWHYAIVILCIGQGDVYFIHILLDIVCVHKTLNMHWKWSVFSSCSIVKIWL